MRHRHGYENTEVDASSHRHLREFLHSVSYNTVLICRIIRRRRRAPPYVPTDQCRLHDGLVDAAVSETCDTRNRYGYDLMVTCAGR
jgi:hypothetical protein